MRRVIIMGAGGRDFHDFNVVFREDPRVRVVAFTAAQIPGIDDRRYPPSLAGPLYPDGIPIRPEEELPDLIRREEVDEVVLAYSDLSHEEVMHKASLVLAAGADFRLLGPRSTMLQASKPVVAVTAVRTGCGKSQTSRKVGRILLDHGLQGRARAPPDAVRRPRGDARAAVRVARRHRRARTRRSRSARSTSCPSSMGMVMYAGVDYGDPRAGRGRGRRDRLGRRQQRPPVLRLRPPDHGRRPAAGRRRADLPPGRDQPPDGRRRRRQQDRQRRPGRGRPGARGRRGGQPARDRHPRRVAGDARAGPVDRGKRVLVVEDGPTLTHGGMSFGAGTVAARQGGAAELVDPRPCAVGSIAETLARYPQVENVLPGDGLQRPAAARAGGDDRRRRLRRRRHRHAVRPRHG